MTKHPSLMAIAAGLSSSNVFAELAHATRYGDSPAVNADPARVAPSGDAGQGVSTKRQTSNLDKSRHFIVRKGMTVWCGSRLGRVEKVRTGTAYVSIVGSGCVSIFRCDELNVGFA